MVHELIGNVGNVFTISAFILAVLSAFSYTYATRQTDFIVKEEWKANARLLFYGHFIAIVGIMATLFSIIYFQYYEYHYAWSHSSKHLPIYYIIACFWEGQEGSFLIWYFWNALLGLVLIKTNKTWEAPLMSVFAFVQLFIGSMILGRIVGDIKIGSSPFILLRNAMEAPIFLTNPNYVPEDGTGLNPLLQNYWMVIHPPTLFLGFATTLVPFAYAIAGLITKRYKEWIQPALPWTIFSTAVLGLGIIMGAYWAYETLNFGGYWNWDPVENAVYVPWLILVASLHTMIIFKKNNTALKTSIILSITSFLLVLYSTFLTRSGVLGNASVHSFTDLGLSGQLLIYLLFFLLGAIFICIWRWKHIPSDEKEVSVYSREFWIFIGVATLSLMSFQVLVPTSIPVWNALVEAFGGVSKIAIPSNQVEFYTKYQLWFAIAVALLSGTGQFFFWKKMKREELYNALAIPFFITLMLSGFIIVVSKVYTLSYILLLTASIYSIVSNAKIAWKLKFKLSGGSISHIGIAFILIGVLYSAGYSNVISLNNTGLIIFEGATDPNADREHLVLEVNQPREMGEYTIRYLGGRIEIKDFPDYIDKAWVTKTEDPFKVISKKDLISNDKKYFMAGDTLETLPENTYFEILFTEKDGNQFKLFPRGQVNPTMGLLASPALKQDLFKDIYTHISSMPPSIDDAKWSEDKLLDLKVGERAFFNDFVTVFEGVEPIKSYEGLDLSDTEVAIKAKIKIYDNDRVYDAEPVFLIKDQQIGKIPFILEDLGIKISLENIDPKNGIFSFKTNTTSKDYIVLKAIEKPLINLLWIGTLLLMLGFSVATYRRYTEFKKLKLAKSNNANKKKADKQLV